MDSKSRREAVRAYKERSSIPGIFRLLCTATGEVWVGASPNVEAARNGVWFSLRLGSHRNASLQAAWRTHGEAAFEYEVLERASDDLSSIARDLWLKERDAHWRAELHARSIVG